MYGVTYNVISKFHRIETVTIYDRTIFGGKIRSVL